MKSPPEENIFFLFVYGTLKRGFSNHDRFCENGLSVEAATTRGRLYDLPFGFPALVAASDPTPVVGTTNYAFDAAEQRRLNATARKLVPGGESKVFGEIFTFDDPVDRLPKLDHLEGFDPGGRSLYRRALIPVETATDNVMAWAYIIDKPTGTHLPGGIWPS